MSDATLVTGSSGARAPRRGDVLGERYEIVEALAHDPLVCTYRGNDQESDATVLVRCTSPNLLGERDARRLVERGRALVGGGGRVLSPLRDVDREGSMVFTVEAWPRGTSLRAVLDARRAKGTTFEAREMLPVIARLAAALASIPEPWWHGDVRAERVWVDPDGLVLTGGFLVSLLPGDAVTDALRDPHDVAMRRAFAPELAEGMGGRASDRWGAASIVWEAMTGRPFEAGASMPSEALGAAAHEIVRLLGPDPAVRPATLDALVAKIAEAARIAVPRVDVDPFPIRTLETTLDEPTQVAADRTPETERPPPFLEAPTERMSSTLDTIEQDLGDEDLGTDPAARPLSRRASEAPRGKSDDTAPHAALGPHGTLERGGDLDPRLVRAALADHELDSRELEMLDERTAETARPHDDLDPHLVRAALGIVDEVPKKKAVVVPKPRKVAGVTQELEASDIEAVRVDKPAVRKTPGPIQAPAKVAAPAPAPAPVRKRPLRQPEPVALPRDIKPIPKPRTTTSESGELSGPVLFDASRPVPAPIPAPAPMAPPAPAPAAPAHAAPAQPSPPQPARTQVMRAPRSAPAWASWVIVLGAIAIGVAIVAGGFWYRARLQREAEQQQFIQQRLRELEQQR